MNALGFGPSASSSSPLSDDDGPSLNASSPPNTSTSSATVTVATTGKMGVSGNLEKGPPNNSETDEFHSCGSSVSSESVSARLHTHTKSKSASFLTLGKWRSLSFAGASSSSGEQKQVVGMGKVKSLRMHQHSQSQEIQEQLSVVVDAADASGCVDGVTKKQMVVVPTVETVGPSNVVVLEEAAFSTMKRNTKRETIPVEWRIKNPVSAFEWEKSSKKIPRDTDRDGEDREQECSNRMERLAGACLSTSLNTTLITDINTNTPHILTNSDSAATLIPSVVIDSFSIDGTTDGSLDSTQKRILRKMVPITDLGARYKTDAGRETSPAKKTAEATDAVTKPAADNETKAGSLSLMLSSKKKIRDTYSLSSTLVLSSSVSSSSTPLSEFAKSRRRATTGPTMEMNGANNDGKETIRVKRASMAF
jgi:hypothetical protein